jgi:hypothetical protein
LPLGIGKYSYIMISWQAAATQQAAQQAAWQSIDAVDDAAGGGSSADAILRVLPCEIVFGGGLSQLSIFLTRTDVT